MKHILSILMAALIAAGCCSCSDGKNDKKSESALDTEAEELTDDIDETAPSENANNFVEYNADDFREIRLNANFTDKKLSYDIQCIKVSDFDLGEKVPVFNRAEFAEQTYTKSPLLKDDASWRDMIDVPVKASISLIHRYNDKLYIVAQYRGDNIGSYDGSTFIYDMRAGEKYDWTAFSYDLKTGEKKEFFSYSAPDLNEHCFSILFEEDKLFYSCRKDDKTCANIIDLDTLEEKTLYESDPEKSMFFYKEDSFENDILLYVSNNDEFVELIAYDTESGTLGELYKDYDSIEAKYDPQVLTTDKYSFRVSDAFAMIMYYDDDRVIIYPTDMSLDIYDLNKMEHYKCGLSSVGDPIFVYDDKVFLHNSWNNKVCCMIPDLGVVYDVLDDVDYAYTTVDAGIIHDCSEDDEKIYVINKPE